jgi:hypothetical protein
VANKEFIQELVKLISPKHDPPITVQEKVLNLIQTWAETFSTQPELKGVVEIYQELKNKVRAAAHSHKPKSIHAIHLFRASNFQLLIPKMSCRSIRRRRY